MVQAPELQEQEVEEHHPDHGNLDEAERGGLACHHPGKYQVYQDDEEHR